MRKEGINAVETNQMDENEFLEPPLDIVNTTPSEREIPYPDDEEETMSSSEIERVKNQFEQKLLQIDGVVGVGIGQNEIGDDAIVVYLRDASSEEKIPAEIGGHPVLTEITGDIDAL